MSATQDALPGMDSTSELRQLVDLLDQIGCRSYSLHATDRRFYAAQNPGAADAQRVSLRLTVVGRAPFEQICTALNVQPTERTHHVGQRAWWAEADTNTRRLLIEGVSFQHHDDWEPRAAGGAS